MTKNDTEVPSVKYTSHMCINCPTIRYLLFATYLPQATMLNFNPLNTLLNFKIPRRNVCVDCHREHVKSLVGQGS